MGKRMLMAAVAATALMAAAPQLAQAQAAKPAAASSVERKEGLLPVLVDAAQGKVMLSLPKPGKDGIAGRYIYMPALKTGLGSAPIGLDKAAAGEGRLLVFRRIGGKVVVEYENPKFRAEGAGPDEQAAARDSFAYSTVWAGKIEREEADGRLVVDISSFLTRDVMGIADSLKRGGEGGFKQVADLSLADAAATKVFPDNIEMEARLTFASETPGPEVRNIAPDSKLITLAVRHSLIKLPEPGFEVRAFDQRSGAFGNIVNDYAAPLGDPIVQRLVSRFRLEKTDPAAPKSRVKKPIVFYVDRAAPEPIRTALQEGAAWWAKAFEDAGYIDAYRVEILPEGADPLDVRYNVINWTNRATRGWSYGQAIADPRTGEIIKGSVLLGSLRVRQDMMIFEALVGADKVGTGTPNDPVVASLARMRQLSAHEVGHALGFAHNFAASTQGRESVMDYPAPRLSVANGQIDLSDAYGVGVGAWDKFIVDWLYGDKASADAKAAAAGKLRYTTDADARSGTFGQPWGSLWDDGSDPAAELVRMMGVRKVAVETYGLKALHPGEGANELRRKFVPVYLLHRYQAEAAVKLIGGLDFAYSVKGDGHEAAAVVPATHQRAALDALMTTLEAANLDVPEAVLPYLSSGNSGDSDRQHEIEVFRTMGGPVFDPLVAADVAAGMTLSNLLDPTRLNRVADQHRRDPANVGVDELTRRILASAFDGSVPAGRLADVRRRVQARTVFALAAAKDDPNVSPTAASILAARLDDLAKRLGSAKGADAESVHARWLAGLLNDRDKLAPLLAQERRIPATPPGMPIGGETDWFGDF
ncbi:zinc-dependent metalloprotease [Caulobacter sp. NIBR2454]|uniref:zinc-dependent metalloprotease n=1 Tax=Caulobacter sp. NIBR2454 TaxID=3015996 RepID=UPI0022B60F41|nr:zinc-dependent metalloprotease [Caulobacter sp. NIBR2454]